MTIKVTPGQSRVLNAICRTGQIKLAAVDLNIKQSSVQMIVCRIKKANKIDSTMELVLTWDRMQRSENGRDRSEQSDTVYPE